MSKADFLFYFLCFWKQTTLKRSLSILQKAKQPEYYHALVFSKAFKWAPKREDDVSGAREDYQRTSLLSSIRASKSCPPLGSLLPSQIAVDYLAHNDKEQEKNE